MGGEVRLSELRRLAEAATPAPWEAVVGSGPKRRKQQYAMVGKAGMRGTGEAGCLAVFAGLNEHRADDADFIVAARNMLPELLDRLAAVEALADEWERSGGRGWLATCADDLRAALGGAAAGEAGE